MKRSVLGFALFLAACGPPSQIDAVNAASTHGCNYYQRCGQIGPSSNDTYPDYQHCMVDLQGKWNAAWPVSSCDGHITSSGFSACISAIDNTACNNVADFFNTVFNKCSQQSVCSG